MSYSGYLGISIFLALVVVAGFSENVTAESPSRHFLDTREFKLLRQQAQDSLEKGVCWLKRQQTADGSWRSRTYSGLEAGAGNTALIFLTFVELRSTSVVKEQDWQQAKNFLITQVNDMGLLVTSEVPSNYPVYATCLFLSGLTELHYDVDRELIALLSLGVLQQQCRIQNDKRFRGGWGPGCHLQMECSESNPANISVTFHALDALAKTGKLSPRARSAATEFLRQCQFINSASSLNGGFFFTPIEDHPLNKAGWFQTEQGTKIAAPYLSTTGDGISALLACGGALHDPRIKLALESLPQLPNSRLAKRPLKLTESYSSLDAIYFYTTAATARVWHQIQGQGISNSYLQKQRNSSLKTLIQSQHPEGSWSNPLPWMMEDDPLIATSFALQAIHRWLVTEIKPAPAGK